MDINNVKEMTMKALGITDPNDVSYITEELLNDYLTNVNIIEKLSGTSPEECKAANTQNPLTGYGTYGNSLVFLTGKVNYKAGPRGTPNYGCGNDNWEWRSDPGDTFTPQASCSGGRQQYLLYCPSC